MVYYILFPNDQTSFVSLITEIQDTFKNVKNMNRMKLLNELYNTCHAFMYYVLLDALY